MGEDLTGKLISILELSAEHVDQLYKLRYLEHLVVSKSGDLLFVAGFTDAELSKAAAIPYSVRYNNRKGHLFKNEDYVPSKQLPSKLVWTPIGDFLPVSMPSLNNNFFGLKEKITISLIPDENEIEAIAMITDIRRLADYAGNAPAFRLSKLRWVLLADMNKALVIGQPLLPMPGVTFWRNDRIFIPTGFNINYPVAIPVLIQEINLENDEWMLWTSTTEYIRINRKSVMPFSRSSLRLTLSK